MHQVTLGLSVHRPEIIPVISEQMRRHDAIILEEPPTPDFNRMLRGELAIHDYLLTLDLEYPEFSRGMCLLLRELQGMDKKIYQIEPFLEVLLQIHDFFAAGHRPVEIQKNTIQYPVYLAERHATSALLAYYQTVMNGSFEQAIAAIVEFARRDAARFRLRDSLRAQQLASVVEAHSLTYVEAGVIHYPLWRLLRKQLSPQVQIRSIFLADVALKAMGENDHLYGPGDQLTLLHIFHPNITNTLRERVLAARSLIYSKIIEKEEMTSKSGTYPHLRDELACIRVVKQLSLDDCGRLFPLIRRAKSSDARQIVNKYLSDIDLKRRQQLETR